MAWWAFAALALVFVIGIVATAGRDRRSPEQKAADLRNILATPLPSATVDEVHRHLASKQQIHAVKVVRDATRIGLREAVELVKAIEKGHQPTLLDGAATGVISGGSASTPAATPARPSDLADRARKLRKDGREVDAIRLVCDETGMGILDAQKFVRALD